MARYLHKSLDMFLIGANVVRKLTAHSGNDDSAAPASCMQSERKRTAIALVAAYMIAAVDCLEDVLLVPSIESWSVAT